MTIQVEIIPEWGGYEMLDILMGVLIVIVTGTMAYYLNKTLNHSTFVASAQILHPYKEKFFSTYRVLYMDIMDNAKKEVEEQIEYTNKKFVSDGKPLWHEMLSDLEMLSIMTSNKTIDENMVFEVFGTLLLTLSDDPQIEKLIQSRQSPSDEKLMPFRGLELLMKNCYNYKYGINKHSFIRFRN